MSPQNMSNRELLGGTSKDLLEELKFGTLK
jgi:hypothetical protein